MLFSQRIGKRSVKVKVQDAESMDQELRNGLWNAFDMVVLAEMPDWVTRDSPTRSHYYNFFRGLWHRHFKLPVDSMPARGEQLITAVRDWFFEAPALDVYDFIEFVAKHIPKHFDWQASPNVDVAAMFVTLCNSVLERELSAYRFAVDQLTQVTDKTELDAIEAAAVAGKTDKLNGMRKHLAEAVAKMSDRKRPDYRNSIKESISAVESIAQVITSKPKATLGDALKSIGTTVELHPAMRDAFSKMYGYTSDEGGIRHAMLDDAKCDFEDAKYMLVACSAFVNFLVGKAAKKGIKL